MYHVQTMYNIKQAAARAGVSVPVLRAWERRYGVIAPERTPSGYRRFDDATVARVRAMRGLVDQGWSPSAAAAAILDGSVAVDGGDAAASPAAGTTPGENADPGSAARPGLALGSGRAAQIEAAGELAGRLVEAARDMDTLAVDAVLDDLFSRGSFERVVVDLLFPALQRLGDAWAAGEVSVAGEHLASSAVLRRLGLALDAAGSQAATGERIVVGLPPGGRHELGALAFAVAARRAGIGVAYLGPDLPVADWVTGAAGASGAVIGVVSARDRRPALDVARALRAAHPELVVAFGGRAAPDEPGVLALAGPLAASVGVLSSALGRAR
jgi:MerR family transcriptional regulator, light-induced transcriptional regulator